MFRRIFYGLLPAILLTGCETGTESNNDWLVDSTEDWTQSAKESEGLTLENDLATPTDDVSHYRSITRSFENKRSASSIVFEQSPVWHNWTPVKNVGPSNLYDAPVLLTVGPGDYWMFGIYGSADRTDFESEDAQLEGFDTPLKTTPFPNQFDAPGGLKEGLGGYHAWQSRDMVNWVHHGPVSEGFSRWVTTAEYVDGKAYIYYDYPNDMDPHLYIDDDLFDGEPGINKGRAFDDPSLGSDCAVIRDEKGDFHIISEDWSPINASRRAWDSPLATHAVSKDGVNNFKMKQPPVDHRTTPTGRVETFDMHPNQNPDSYPDCPFPARFPASEYKIAKYEVHEPEQPAYGDWASISIGGQYYLFGDFDRPGEGHKNMSVGWFTSPSLDEEFSLCGHIGHGHPDPDIGFADGRFYLVTQLQSDYVSSGPWVDTVEARVGVDTNKDGSIDSWTDWQEVKEHYDYVEGFSKQVKRTPATMDLSQLPAGYGFSFEFRTEDTTQNESKPILDSVKMSFK